MSNEYCIETDQDTHKTIQFLEDKIYEYNSSKTHVDDGCLFSRIVKSGDKEIIAGIAGWTWTGICEITQLWVDRKIRGRGIGKILLEAAELEARCKGCRTILIKSYSFQAPHFYEKHGYKTEHIINGFPEGHGYHILTKQIS
jgi:ribosomal protein S18 acetylase RimI-like enzyme